ncbi:DUF4838 domain-containing protein [Cohnella sp. GCM10012308]|uniref:DUF4838 domain-containing protein n=1 Tax=Cohnella sp. GCM10012308 TaxID=3317329 RepID=UPI00360B9A2B
MTLKSKGKKVFVLALMLCLLCSAFSSSFSVAYGADANPTDSAASSTPLFPDLDGHWAEESLKKWASIGLIKGYSDGTFQPDRTVNRGEAFALINRSFGLNEQVPIDFSDLAVSDWEYEDVAKALKAGYITGYSDGTIGARQRLSRLEAAIMIARLLGLEPKEDHTAINAFTDADQIPTWGKEAVAAMVTAQVMQGYGDKSFKPNAFITRAEIVVILDRALNLATPNEYNQSGTYGPVDRIRTVNGNVSVNASGVTLQNMKITGSLLLNEGIKEGEVILKNVTVLGTTTVKGGGINSIHFENSVLSAVIVDKATGTVRIVVEGTTIAEVIVKSSVILEVGKEAKIVTMLLEAIAKVSGLGVIEKATLNPKAKGTTFETRPLQLDDQSGGSQGQTGPYVVPAQNTIVENGAAKARIIIDEDASQRTREAADTFKKYVQKSTGAALSIVTIEQLAEPSTDDKANIYIGVSRIEDQSNHQALLNQLNVDGFIIDSQVNNITIIGSTDWGTEFGVNEFLERYLDIRWLMPGPDGEDVPSHSTVTIPRTLVKEEPATISRHFFGTEASMSVTNAEWAARNRMHDNIQFHHNLANLFDPVVFKNHPEYYVDGVVPTHPYDWQPCFNDTTAAVAIQRIKAYFQNNPDSMSYSLGMNDSHRFCEKPGQLNSVGLENLSDVYYPWVNKVVEGVLAEYPDKYFGLLAYSNLFDPPTTVTLNAHVIPYITEDRMTWIDQTNFDLSNEVFQRWKQAATNVAWYEYLYGWPYNLPRVFPHQMAENYKYAQDQGVIAHVAELFPNFGEGPKPWLSAKLQWNADQNVDELLDDWYKRAVGEAAAPYLKDYYDLWEDFWTRRILDTDWYERFKSERYYLRFDQPDYLQPVTKEDITQSRNLLEQAVAKAQTSQQKKRAELLLRSFEFYEASALSYPRSGPVATPANEQQAAAMLNDIKQSFAMAQKRTELVTQFKGDPILELPVYPPGMGGNWDGVQRSLISALKEYVKTEPANGAIGPQLAEFLDAISSNYSEMAVKTTASKAEILQSLDFSTGPWANAKPFTEFNNIKTQAKGPYETKVYLLWDDTNLYVGYENFDDHLEGMVLSDDAPNGWWRSGGDDSVETFMVSDPSGGITGFFTNPREVKFNYHQTPGYLAVPSTVAGWENKSVIKSDRWNTIQVIPLESIGVDPEQGKSFKAYFLRNYHGQTEFLGWLGAAPWKLESFKTINMVEGEGIIQNGSFETGEATDPDAAPPWYLEGSTRTDEKSRTGGHSLLIKTSTVAPATPFQDMPITPGKYRTTFHYFLPAGSSTLGTVHWEINVKNANYKLLDSIVSPDQSASDAVGKWSKVTVDFEVLPSYIVAPTTEAPGRVQPVIFFTGFADNQKVYLDDVTLYPFDGSSDPGSGPGTDPGTNPGQTNLIPNGSFDSGDPTAPPWYVDKAYADDVIERTTDYARTGEYSLAVNMYNNPNGYDVAAFLDLPITPGQYEASFHYFVPENSTTNGSLVWEAHVKTAAYGVLSSKQSDAFEVAATKGQWAKATIQFTVDPSYAGGVPGRVQPVIYVVGFKQGEYVYIDDVTLQKLN